MKKSEFNILVAEDDAMVRDVIVKFLSDEGYSVIVANDGLDAIRLLRLEEVKLVLADLRMPGADGMEVLRTAVQINPKMAVVLLTAYGTLDTALEAMKEGAYDYIVKPFVMQQLLLVARNAYKMANMMEDNEKLTNQLKDMHRSIEGVKTEISTSTEIKEADPTERIRQLQEMKVISSNEARILIERLVSGTTNTIEESTNEDSTIRKYNSLINGLKIDSDN